MSSNVYLALSLVQGLALNHTETKVYLGKAHALHVSGISQLGVLSGH